MYTGTSGYDFLLFVIQNTDIFLVILVRMLGFFMMLPIFAGNNVPTQAKIGFAAAVSTISFVSGSVYEVSYYDNIFGYAFLLMTELFVGLIIAFCVSTIFSLFYFVGQLVDYQIGFSMVSVFDPVSQVQVPITGNLFYLIICAFFVRTDGIGYMIQVIYHSYELLPPGTAILIGNGELFYYILTMLLSFLVISIKVALPVVATILVVDVALGLLVKAVPQMNVFVVGMPIKLLIGLLVLYFIAPVFGSIYGYIYNETMAFVFNIIKGMMPK